MSKDVQPVLPFNKDDYLQTLEPDAKESRAQWRELSKNEIMRPIYNMPLDYSRELAYKRLKVISDAKVLSIYDFGKEPGRVFAAHEMAGMIDSS